MKYLGFLLPAFLLVCCTEGDRTDAPRQEIQEYYDVDDLLKRQMRKLAAENAQLIKQVSYTDREESDTLQLTAQQIRQELRMFTEMDINRPVLSGRYRTSVVQENGMEVTRYQADEPEDLRVNYLEVYRKGEEVQRLEAVFSDRNLLYNSTRKLTMTLNQQQLPESYSIVGIQRMIFRDSVEYSIRGRFVY